MFHAVESFFIVAGLIGVGGYVLPAVAQHVAHVRRRRHRERYSASRARLIALGKQISR